MLVVLDTNVLLSALRTDTSPPAAILNAWSAGAFQLVTSIEQIDEFKRAARYPKLRTVLPRGAVGRVVNQLRAAEVLLDRLRRAGGSPDPGDDYLLAMAAAAEADYLVTGDRALLSLNRVAETRIVTPRRFAAILAR
ncbi:MAG: putative toxin-antitoxin system toxin component, PIN family [Burkholderiales bacterium]